MVKLATPFVARRGRQKIDSPFKEGVSISPEAWKKEVSANPALASNDRKERSEAITKSVLTGELAKYRRR